MRNRQSQRYDLIPRIRGIKIVLRSILGVLDYQDAQAC